MIFRNMLPLSFLCLILQAYPVAAGDWLRFRGPNGSGVSSDTDPLPDSWSEDSNMAWKIPLPGRGSSSPIIVGDRIYLTCWSGYGMSPQDLGDQSQLQRHLLCIDRKDGSIVWNVGVQAELPEDVYRGMFAEHGYASHTPISDGERIYVFFGKSGVLAFDLDGNQLWRTPVGSGTDPRGWGSSSSPVLYNGLVIVTASAESESLVGLDVETGEEVWRQRAGGLSSTWGTPVLVDVEEGRTDLVLGVPNEIWGINPETGKLRWYCPALNTDSYCSSVIVGEGGLVYGIEGRSGGSVAVRAGGSGDVTDTHVVWSGRDRNRIGTPVLYEGLLYYVSGGILNCIDAESGNQVYQARLTAAAGSGGGGRGGGGRGGQDYSSPVIADGKLYFVTRGGVCHVVAVGPEFNQLAANVMTTDSEDFSATPAIGNGQIIIRSSHHLYCISFHR